MQSNKYKLSHAFKYLRTLGYTARVNFQSSRSNAWYELDTKGKSDKCVFFTTQERENYLDGKPIYLAWNGDGDEICQALGLYDIQSSWDGDKDKCIVIKNYV